ncbi:hypothetical protein R83H12_01379 [Fibrobacteria bacterium R8-3-H12]
MALLLPFYILKIRKELEKKGIDSVKRKILSKRLEGYIIEIGKVFKRLVQNNYISNMDAAMLLHRLLNMHRELYGKHKEFVEVDMTLEKLVEVDVYKAVDKAVAKTEKRCIKQGISRTAKAMKAGGEAIDKIRRYTGLSRREIMAL